MQLKYQAKYCDVASGLAPLTYLLRWNIVDWTRWLLPSYMTLVSCFYIAHIPVADSMTGVGADSAWCEFAGLVNPVGWMLHACIVFLQEFATSSKNILLWGRPGVPAHSVMPVFHYRFFPLNLCRPAEFSREKSAPGADFYTQMSPPAISYTRKVLPPANVSMKNPPPSLRFRPQSWRSLPMYLACENVEAVHNWWQILDNDVSWRSFPI